MSRRDDIIDAAVKEFGAYSYDAASVNRIIKASGTSKGTFYHYFSDKKTLYFAIIEDSIRLKQEYFKRMLEKMQLKDGDFFDMMKAQAKAALEFMRSNPELYKFGTRFAKEQNGIKTEFQEKYMPAINSTFMEIVRAGIAAGSFSKRYPPEFPARVVGYITLNYYDILFDRDDTPPPEKIEQSLDMLFDFLKKGFS